MHELKEESLGTEALAATPSGGPNDFPVGRHHGQTPRNRRLTNETGDHIVRKSIGARVPHDYRTESALGRVFVGNAVAYEGGFFMGMATGPKEVNQA
jgi:hypothetical protein